MERFPHYRPLWGEPNEGLLSQYPVMWNIFWTNAEPIHRRMHAALGGIDRKIFCNMLTQRSFYA